MEITFVEGLRTLKLDLVLTLALAAVFLFTGYGLQRRLAFLSRASIPAPAIGGLLFALLVLALRARGTLGVTLDTSLRAPLQTAFFTTIGLGATVSLLRAGGWRMGFFWLLTSLAAVVQNASGIGVALVLGAPAALGIICGSLTLTGGPATGLAFTETFERLGIEGAGALIIASATFGIFMSSLVGNPTATALIKRFRLAAVNDSSATASGSAGDETRGENIIRDIADEAGEGDEAAPLTVDEDRAHETSEALTGYVLLRHLALILAVMGAGALFSLGLARAASMLPPAAGKLLTLPGYIGAMIVAAIVRNADDRLGWLKIDARAVEALGTIALALFLVIALMDLKLWQLAGLAVPMLVILVVQVVLMIAFAVVVTFTLMGRDYEAAVTTSGHIGFGLGITPNAVANMEAITARYGAAPRSFLIVPVVGAFFIDFSNTLIINLFANWIG
ncbi:MAG TPA: sodium/glutamate symporter [Pyrinomonadaceae bacterium]|nr:sodium/glutamate symporter [Pyrinomonadaceae bacterium]